MRCDLEETRWKIILNLLTEELDVWEKFDGEYAFVESTIAEIERQTGIRKKARNDKGGDGQ